MNQAAFYKGKLTSNPSQTWFKHAFNAFFSIITFILKLNTQGSVLLSHTMLLRFHSLFKPWVSHMALSCMSLSKHIIQELSSCVSVSWLFMFTYAHTPCLFFSGFGKSSSFGKRALSHKLYFNNDNKKYIMQKKQSLQCWNLPYLELEELRQHRCFGVSLVQKSSSLSVEYPSVDS